MSNRDITFFSHLENYSPGNLKPPKKTNKENLKKIEDDFGPDVDLEFSSGSSQLKVRNKSFAEERTITDGANNRSLQSARLGNHLYLKQLPCICLHKYKHLMI